MPGIAIEKLSKTFVSSDGREVHALRDFTLDADAGELVVLVGPSGSGKTTCLRLIAGLEEASAGTISIAGKRIDSLQPHEREVSMAFQDHALYPHLSVGDNLALGLKLRKIGRAELDRRTAETAQVLGLTQMLGRMPATLSGGERQRVALGRALVVDPKVLLLDEPLSNLDAPLRVQLRREIGRLHRRFAGTILYVTHDQMEAMNLADRMVVMKDGVIQQVDNPMNVYQHPSNTFVAGFIGSPPMNLFQGRIVAQGRTCCFQGSGGSGQDQNGIKLILTAAHREKLAEHSTKEIVLGLRPEHFRPMLTGEVGDSPGPIIRASVELVEPIGPELHLYLRAAEESFVVRAAPSFQAKAGDEIEVRVEMSQARLFDADDGAAFD